MRRQIIFISGPYRSRWGVLGIAWNIWKARRVAVRYWRAGYTAICPHCNSAFMDWIGLAGEEWIARDLDLLGAADCIAMLPGWERSVGARTERMVAAARGIPILSEYPPSPASGENPK